MALGNSRFGEWASGPLKLGGGDGSVTDIAPSGKNGGNYRSFFGSSPGGGGVAFDPSALDSSFNSQPGTGANLGASLSPGGGGSRPWGSLGGSSKNDDSGMGPAFRGTVMGPPSKGGGYGIGGQGPGGFNQSAGLGFFDDGGEVGGGEVGGDYSGGNTSQVDPMQIVKGALAYGRQKMGLPAVFHDDPEQQNGSVEQQGFDDGGPVLDEGGSGGQEQGQQPINPQSTIQYLTGTGQLAPEVADALEQQVDPEGTMDPAQRKLMAIAQAPTQDAKFGLMQHYRTRYNAHSGAARAALDQGNLTTAAQHAMQAFHNVPTGMSVKFAPAGGGLAMHATKVGQQGFDQGGAVDITNPSVLMKQQEKGFEDGGEVGEEEDTREDPPASENVEDRRGVDEIDPMTRGTAMDRQKMTTRSDNMADFGILRDELSGSGRVKKQTAYDDGGGVLEEEGAPEEVLADENPADETPEDSQPTVLTPEQVKAALGPGTYDEALDRGWGAWLQKVLSQGASNLNPVGAAEAGETRSPLLNPKQYFKDKGLFGMSNSPAEEVEKRFPDEGEMPAPVAPQPVRPQPPEPQAPTLRAPAPQQPFGSSTMELQGAPEKPAAREKPTEEADPDKDIMRRLNRVANQLFPSVGQQDQRSAYIAYMYEKYQDQQSRERVATTAANAKTDSAEIGGSNRAALQDKKDAASMERALLSNDGKNHRAAMLQATSLLNNADNNKMKLNGQLLMTDNNLLKDPQKLNAMFKAVGDSLGLSVPAAARLAITMAQQGGGGGKTPEGGQPQQQAPAPKVGNPNAAKAGAERPVRNPDTGKEETWYFGNDGNWHKKH